MTTWNYRVIKKSSTTDQDATFQIHEVYYHSDGSIDCWNHVPVEPLGISEPGLRNDVQSFLGAFRLPVLEERFVNGRSLLVEEKPIKTDSSMQEDYINKASRASGYINQILGNHILLKQEPNLRKAYEKVDQALNELREIVIDDSKSQKDASRVLTR
ncbi:MAG: hypothetical protein V7459_01540 [Oceanicoccus sp.]